MAKQDSIQQENNWDSGTYQTGSSKPGKNQSGLITGLLIAVIFLGGLASAMGLMNVKLLSQLMKQQNAVLPLSVDATQGDVNSLLRENQTAVPRLPEERTLELKVGERSQALPATGYTDLTPVATVLVQTNQGLQRTGPALIISSDGFILTNAHLVKNAVSITLTLQHGEELSAVPVASDAYSDLAVLYVQAKGLPAAVFAPEPARHGDTLNAPVQCDALTAGAFLESSQDLTVGGNTLTWQKTDFATDHGPVFNAQGQVTGFLSRCFGREEDGHLLPSAQLMDIATQLVQQNAVSGRPSLGLQVRELSNFARQYWDLSSGLEITELTVEAKNADLLEGDILLRVNGKLLTEESLFYEALMAAQMGESLELWVFRAGQRFKVTLPVIFEP